VVGRSPDRLLSNPWAQPPLPSDWEVQPTYPRYQEVPYFLAPLYDANVAERRAQEQKHRNNKVKRTADEVDTKGYVSKELREKLKRAKAAKGFLMDIEEEIRKFVKDWEQKQTARHSDGLVDIDSDEEEIVFVGRNGQMHDLPPSPKAGGTEQAMADDLKKEKLILDSLADDRAAGFGYDMLEATTGRVTDIYQTLACALSRYLLRFAHLFCYNRKAGSSSSIYWHTPGRHRCWPTSNCRPSTAFVGYGLGPRFICSFDVSLCSEYVCMQGVTGDTRRVKGAIHVYDVKNSMRVSEMDVTLCILARLTCLTCAKLLCQAHFITISTPLQFILLRYPNSRMLALLGLKTSFAPRLKRQKQY
jgi:hypothetical protein